ncbi:hypothetical protein Agub_g1695, partial [Astrephomene gubernaculifera]
AGADSSGSGSSDGGGGAAAAAAAFVEAAVRQLSAGLLLGTNGTTTATTTADDGGSLALNPMSPGGVSSSSTSSPAQWLLRGVSAAWGGGALSEEALGAGYVLLSCVFWGMATVRLGAHSARFAPLHLAAAAAAAYAGLSLMWLLAEVTGSPSAGLADFLELRLLLRNPRTAAALLWAGLGPGALSSYLQAVGQQTVPPAQAQVLFSSTPLWSALLARLLLPGEEEGMGGLAWLGGGVMLAASLMASLLTG